MPQTTIGRVCETCGRTFVALAAQVKRGHARFCSLSCSARRTRARKPANVACANCASPLYREPSDLKARRLHFCSKRCKTTYQWRHVGPPVNNYKDGRASYRELALRLLPNACNRCGFADCVEILEAHHRDADRNNNAAANLEILCPTCHRLHHFRTQSGPWQALNSRGPAPS